MQLNVSSDIALRTLIYVGAKSAPATIQEIATACGVSKSHLMKVVMALVNGGFLASTRGRNGGISLALNARDISIGSVVRLMEYNLALVECMKNESSTCPLLPRCRLKGVFHKAQEAFFATLDKSSLADLLK